MPAIVTPQILLCGLLVPRDQMAVPLEWLSTCFRSTYAYDALEQVTASGETDADVWLDVGIVAGCIVLALALGRRRCAAGLPDRRLPPWPRPSPRTSSAAGEEWEYGRSRGGLPLRVQLPASGAPVAGLLIAAQHGEEAETGLLARRLLERIPGDETSWAVVQVANPDGLLNGTRQNAAGVDLNRNFPGASWSPEPSFTFPPGIDPELRKLPNRTSRSSPGPEPAPSRRRAR